MKRTHCHKGHEYAVVGKDADGSCPVCRRGWQVAAYARRRAAVLKRIAAGDNRCAKGHPLSAAMVNSRGECRLCRSERWRELHPEKPKLLCRKGLHPRIPENRTPNDQCRLCVNIAQRARKATLRGEALARYQESQRIWANGKRRKHGTPERQWTEKAKRGNDGGQPDRHFPAGPFLAWLEDYVAIHSADEFARLARAAGCPKRSMAHFRRQSLVRARTVEDFLAAAGAELDIHLLYPGDEAAPVVPTVKRQPKSGMGRCRSGDGCARDAGRGPNGRFCEHHGLELDRVFAALNPTAEQQPDFDKRRRRAFVNGNAARVEVGA